MNYNQYAMNKTLNKKIYALINALYDVLNKKIETILEILTKKKKKYWQ